MSRSVSRDGSYVSRLNQTSHPRPEINATPEESILSSGIKGDIERMENKKRAETYTDVTVEEFDDS